MLSASLKEHILVLLNYKKVYSLIFRKQNEFNKEYLNKLEKIKDKEKEIILKEIKEKIKNLIDENTNRTLVITLDQDLYKQELKKLLNEIKKRKIKPSNIYILSKKIPGKFPYYIHANVIDAFLRLGDNAFDIIDILDFSDYLSTLKEVINEKDYEILIPSYNNYLKTISKIEMIPIHDLRELLSYDMNTFNFFNLSPKDIQWFNLNSSQLYLPKNKNLREFFEKLSKEIKEFKKERKQVILKHIKNKKNV